MHVAIGAKITYHFIAASYTLKSYIHTQRLYWPMLAGLLSGGHFANPMELCLREQCQCSIGYQLGVKS